MLFVIYVRDQVFDDFMLFEIDQRFKVCLFDDCLVDVATSKMTTPPPETNEI